MQKAVGKFKFQKIMIDPGIYEENSLNAKIKVYADTDEY